VEPPQNSYNRRKDHRNAEDDAECAKSGGARECQHDDRAYAVRERDRIHQVAESRRAWKHA